MSNELVTRDGEIVEVTTPDTSNLSAVVRAEIDSAITTARQYPRRMKVVIDNIVQLATMDEATAAECIYALNRGGKAIRGPSIRMAEIIAQQWGNNRVDARVIETDRENKMITAEATFHDLESNSLVKSSVKRRISDRYGRVYNDDMIVVTGNAACSIARRNAILSGVPKAIWGRGLQAAEQIVRGDAKTLVERRDAAVAAFAHFGATPAQVFQLLGVKGMDDIGLDELVTLRATYSSIKDGQVTIEEALNIARGTPAADHKKIGNPLADDDPSDSAPRGHTREENAADHIEKDGVTLKSTADLKAVGGGEPEHAASNRAEPGGDTASGPEAQKAASEGKPEAKEDRMINVARQLGTAARKKGAMRKDMPEDYREPSREAEAKAWLAGYDAAEPKKN